MFVIGSYPRSLRGGASGYKDIDAFGTRDELISLLAQPGHWSAGEFIKDHMLVLMRGLKQPAIEFTVIPSSLLAAMERLPENTAITLRGVPAKIIGPITDNLMMWALRDTPHHPKHNALIKAPPLVLPEPYTSFYTQYCLYLHNRRLSFTVDGILGRLL